MHIDSNKEHSMKVWIGYESYYNGCDEFQANNFSQAVKQHFGVEE